MGRALEADMGPYKDGTVSGVGQELARFYYVMLCDNTRNNSNRYVTVSHNNKIAMQNRVLFCRRVQKQDWVPNFSSRNQRCSSALFCTCAKTRP